MGPLKPIVEEETKSLWKELKPKLKGLYWTVGILTAAGTLIGVQSYIVARFVSGPEEPFLWHWLLNPFDRWNWWASYAVRIPVYVLIAAGLLTLWLEAKRQYINISRRIAVTVLCAFLVVEALCNTWLYHWIETETTLAHADSVLQRAQASLEAGNVRLGLRLLEDAQGALSPRHEQFGEALALLGESYVEAGRYSESIEVSCRLLAYGDRTRVEESAFDRAATNIHSSLYYISHTQSESKAEDDILSVRRVFGDACAEATSRYWMAINPGTVFAMERDPFQHGGDWDWPYDWQWTRLSEPPDTSVLYQEDKSYLRRLIERFPEEPGRDLALFMVGNDREIILRHQDSALLDYAYYSWGLEAFEERDYESAIQRFNAFLAAFPDHEWHDDALWRIAKAYSALGDQLGALSYLFRALHDENGDGQLYGVCGECDFAYLIDTLPLQDIAGLAALSERSEFIAVLEYGLAERLLVDGRYQDALDAFAAVRQEYPDVRINFRLLSDLCQERIVSLGQLLALIDDKEPVLRTYWEAQFFLRNSGFLLNRLWSFVPKSISTGNQPVDSFLGHNADFRAATFLTNAIALAGSSNTLPKPESEIRAQIAQAYRTVAADRGLSDADAIEMLRALAVDQYRLLLSQTPSDTPEFDRLFERIGGIYIERPRLGSPWLEVYTLDDVRGMRREYLRLVEEYPAHHLANNALNWVAWSYCFEANLYDPSAPEYEENYRDALHIYEFIRDRYVGGGVWENARKNVQTIEDKLQDPAKRVPVDETRWEW